MVDRPSLFDARVDDDPSIDRSRGSATSAAAFAAKLASGSVDSDRAQVLQLVRAAGSYGLTCDECAIQMNRPPNGISGRFSELTKRGLIAKTDRRRRTQAGGTAVVCAKRRLAVMPTCVCGLGRTRSRRR